ncbi:MAG: hypothetical protein RL518_326 [Pseudomonadota bacterium]
MAVDGLPNSHQDDLSWLKAGGKGSGARFAAMVVLWFGALVLSVLLIFFILHQLHGSLDTAQSIQHHLLERQEPWSERMAQDLESYRGWLERYGTGAELSVFDDISAVLAQSALAMSTSPSESLLASLYVSAHSGIVRALFLIIASFRLWVATLLIAAYCGLTSYRPYKGDDILGQTGNGRLFYSGARGGLENLAPSGAPDVLVRGLACPDYATKTETHASSIWKTLSEWGATNATNEALAAILTKHGDTASYIPRLEDEGIYDQCFKGASLKEHVPNLLQVALELHSSYASGNSTDLPEDALPVDSLHGANSETYARALQGALHQVLSPHLRTLIGQLSAQEVATFVLALESGKIIAHSYEAGKWFRRSNFPHLSARAILHSVVAYPREFDFFSRQRIRQALVYASRTSSFAPVRMPIGMTDDIWALRQWAEVLLASPHELSDAVHEIELVGLVRAAHTRFEREVLPKALSFVPELTTTSFTTMSDLFFLPLESIVTLLGRTVEPHILARIAHLSSIVGVKQKQRIERAQASEEGAGTTLIYDRVFAPITDEEVAQLASLHTLNPAEIREWSSLRNILASFGWLARRVGDYTVPESSIIFSVFKTPANYPGANTLNLIGKSGLVPLRGSKFREVLGGDWDRKFQNFQRATMSESREDFERVLKGIAQEVVEEPITAPPASVS